MVELEGTLTDILLTSGCLRRVTAHSSWGFCREVRRDVYVWKDNKKEGIGSFHFLDNRPLLSDGALCNIPLVSTHRCPPGDCILVGSLDTTCRQKGSAFARTLGAIPAESLTAVLVS